MTLWNSTSKILSIGKKSVEFLGFVIATVSEEFKKKLESKKKGSSFHKH